MVGVGVVIVGIWGLLVLLMGVAGVFGGCWCFLGFVFVWSGSGVVGWLWWVCCRGAAGVHALHCWRLS